MVVTVDFDEIDTAEDGTGKILLDGQPFSGIAFERDADSGALLGLAGFCRGARHGPWRDWDTNGQLRSERHFFKGFRHGPWREWHENGKLAYDGYWECDFLVRRKRWNEHGGVIDSYEMTPDSRDFPTLKKRRAERHWSILDIDLETMEFLERPQGWGRDGKELV